MVNDLVPIFYRSEFQSVTFPSLERGTLCGAVVREDGEEWLVGAQVSKFDSANPVYQAQAVVELADERLGHQRKIERKLRRKRSWTDPLRVVVVAEKDARLTWQHKLTAFVLLLLAFAAIGVSNQVGMTYVMARSDLYATDPTGASMFMVLVVLASAALKVFEHRLATDAARRLFNHFIFGLGAIAFMLWTAMMALSFAPDTAGSTAWLTGNAAYAQTTAELLLLSHLVADVACGYTIFSGSEYLALAGRKRVVIASPLYDELTRRVDAAWAEIDRLTQTRASAEAYLARVADARKSVEHTTRLAFHREAAGARHGREAAAALATAKFLTR